MSLVLALVALAYGCAIALWGVTLRATWNAPGKAAVALSLALVAVPFFVPFLFDLAAPLPVDLARSRGWLAADASGVPLIIATIVAGLAAIYALERTGYRRGLETLLGGHPDPRG